MEEAHNDNPVGANDNANVNVDSTTDVNTKKKLLLLISIIVFLLIAIVGLVAAIFIFKPSEESQQTSGGSGTKCDRIADEDKMRECLSEGDYEQNKGESYYKAIEQAFNDKNYGLFERLVDDRTTGLVLPGWCEDTFSFLETIEKNYLNELPILNQYGFYVIGTESAVECENSEREEYYVGKMDAILADDRYHEAILESEEAQRNYMPEEVNDNVIQEVEDEE